MLTHTGWWASTIVHCYRGFFSRSLQVPTAPKDSKLHCDGQNQYAKGKLRAGGRTKPMVMTKSAELFYVVVDFAVKPTV